METKRFDDDAELLKGCIARDEDAWRALVTRYSGLISSAIRRHLKRYNFTLPSQDIDDIRQSVLHALWKNNSLQKVRNAGSLSYWIAISSGNFALQYMRRKKYLDPPGRVSPAPPSDGPDPCSCIPSEAPGPAAGLEKNEASRLVHEAVDRLPVRERLILKLQLIHDKKFEEIAAILGLPLGTVCSDVKRAREQLKKYLKDLQ